jgi:hypothetical protein
MQRSCAERFWSHPFAGRLGDILDCFALELRSEGFEGFGGNEGGHDKNLAQKRV